MRALARAHATLRRLGAGVLGVAVGASGLLLGVVSPAQAALPCGPRSNPIVCENSKPGADPAEWDVDGAGDSSIQGFATDISVDAGNTIEFKINTDASAYTVDIYRTGWYGGLGARQVASVVPSVPLPQSQPACLTVAETGLVDCGNWAVSASWAVPATAVSGVYVALLRRSDTGGTSHIIFIVRDDDSHSPIVFQTSDTTWQAYNTYGGSNLYEGVNGRAYKVSYNRPFLTRDGLTSRDFYFGAEYPMVRFLERNGYDVSYQAGVDTARSGQLLTNHQVFLSVGHDEYWSGPQRANVEAARDAGVNLAFFSGNEAYWRIRYEDSVAGPATSYRTLVCYKETWAEAKIDPVADEWTGTWRDPRLAAPSTGAGRPENGLTGTAYMANNSDLPLTVSAQEGGYRLWRHTPLASLPAGTSVQLAPHTVGYESDEDLDNGARPPGLIRLSTTVGEVTQYLQDFGNTVAPGTTTHHTTLYRAPSGALVFSAGSIQWSWGLDATHDGDGAPADSRMQQATVNMLADMGVHGATLMSGLVAPTTSSDTTGPTVTITAPAEGEPLPNGARVTVTGTAADTGGRVAGVEVSTDGGQTWRPAAGTTSWSYSYIQAGVGDVPLMARAIDDSANVGAPLTRTLAVTCPCSLYGLEEPPTPAADDASAVELGQQFRSTIDGFATGVRFYKGPGNSGVHTGSLWDSSGQRLASVNFSAETPTGWQEATFPSPVRLTAGQVYTVSYTAPAGRYAVELDAWVAAGRDATPLVVDGGYGVAPAGVFGAAGTFPTASYRWSSYFVDVLFNTEDTSDPSVLRQQPLDGATSVPVTSPVSAVLSKDIVPDSAAVQLAGPDGVGVPGTTAYDALTRTLTFTPADPLASSTRYTVTVTAEDDRGVEVSSGGTWSFTTAVPDQQPGARTLSFYNDSDVPEIVDVADDSSVTLGIRFASSVPGTVDGIRFYKGPANTGTHVGSLWKVGSDQPLAQATFQVESTTGWQTVTFATPVPIDADTEYIAAYRAPVGRYSATLGAFSGPGVARGPLRTAPDSGTYTYADGYPSAQTSTSYLVDVVFTQAPAPLAVAAQTPNPGDLGVPLDSQISVTFTAPLAGAPVLSLATGGEPVAGQSVRSADGRTLTFTPAAPLEAATSYTATTTALTSDEGSTLAPVTWTFTTHTPDGCPCTLLAGELPEVPATSDASSVELGMAFTPSEDGLVTGVRFYKGPGNGGTHTGSLWSADGERLRTVTFTDETPTGWQTAMFATPYEVTAGRTYLVSYLAPQGHYSATAGYFAVDRTVDPLTAPAGANGRYAYGGGFPTSSWQSTNYFVDVVFTQPPPGPVTVTATAPPAGAQDISVGATVSATLSGVPDTGSVDLSLTGPGGAIPGESVFTAATRTVIFTPSVSLPPGAVIDAVASLDGISLPGGSWQFTTATPPAPGACPCSLWTDDEVPDSPSWDDPAAVQVGTRFTVTQPGTVSAIRFYKGAANTGVHTVKLWSGDGELLGTAASSAESASGWQTVRLSTPIPVVPGQVYVAAYHSSTGSYAVSAGALATERIRGPLATPPQGGSYVYGEGFPSAQVGTWYGVDVLFAPTG